MFLYYFQTLKNQVNSGLMCSRLILKSAISTHEMPAPFAHRKHLPIC